MKRFLTSLSALMFGLLWGPTGAQVTSSGYPNKPVELVVSFAPGGGVDTMARVFAEVARPHFAQPFVVVNRPGASGSLGLSHVAQAPADGYKVAMVFIELLTIPLMGISKVQHEDFVPIAKLAADPSTVAVRADAPWQNLEDFMAHAKANPGKLTFSNAGNGSISHIAAASLAQKTGLQFTHVPYQGSGPAVLGLLGGQVDATAVNFAALNAHITSGKVRVLASMSERRYPNLDRVPTLREKGIDLTVDVWRGLAVAKNTPREVVDALRQLASKAANDPQMQESVRKQSLTLAYEDGPEFQKTWIKESQQLKQTMGLIDLKN